MAGKPARSDGGSGMRCVARRPGRRPGPAVREPTYPRRGRISREGSGLKRFPPLPRIAGEAVMIRTAVAALLAGSLVAQAKDSVSAHEVAVLLEAGVDSAEVLDLLDRRG